MKNREQIRARNALKASIVPIPGEEGGQVIKKIPPLIMNHGLLAVGAYAFEEKKDGYKKIFGFIAEHLADPEIALIPKEITTAEKLMDYLTNENSAKLKLVTAEAMAWLNYARRFIKQNAQEKNQGR